MLTEIIIGAGIAGLAFFAWTASGAWFDRRDMEKRRKAELGLQSEPLSRLTRVKPRSLASQIQGKHWAMIALTSGATAILSKQPVLVVGSAVVIYLTIAFFGTDPMEGRIKTMEDNIAWVQTLTYLLQTSKSAWDSLKISAKSLPPSTAQALLSNLERANTTTSGYVIRLRDALTLFAVNRGDPQVDMTVALVNANISSSGGSADYEVMESIRAQLKEELTEQSAAVSARREIFTIAKIMFPAVVILEALLMAMMGSFIGPFYRTPVGYLVALFTEGITIGLLFLFRKFSAPLPETRLIVPKTFQEALMRQVKQADRAAAAARARAGTDGGYQTAEEGNRVQDPAQTPVRNEKTADQARQEKE